MLGKLTDREVAEKLNRTLGAVRDRRKFRGKPAAGHAPQPFRMEREPRDRYARLFATKSNQEVRAILGWSYKRIHTRRRQLAGGKSESNNRNERWRKIVCWERSRAKFSAEVWPSGQRRATSPLEAQN